MAINKNLHMSKSELYVNDYMTLKSLNKDGTEKDKTYQELTIAERQKLRKMLISGHRLVKSKKPLKLIKNRNHSKYFYYMNPSPWVILIKAVLRGIEAFNVDKSMMKAITIIDKKWQTSLRDFDLNITAIRAKLCQELRGKDALVMIEFAFLNNKVIAAHCQGIMWSELTAEDEKTLATRFDAGKTEINRFKKGFLAKEAHDVVGAVAYMIKLPTYAYKKPAYPGADDTTRLSNRDCFRLFRKLRKMKKPATYFDMMIGVGEGVKLKAAIMEHLGVKSYVKLHETQ